jgi:hypothetical protein
MCGTLTHDTYVGSMGSDEGSSEGESCGGGEMKKSSQHLISGRRIIALMVW